MDVPNGIQTVFLSDLDTLLGMDLQASKVNATGLAQEIAILLDSYRPHGENIGPAYRQLSELHGKVTTDTQAVYTAQTVIGELSRIRSSFMQYFQD